MKDPLRVFTMPAECHVVPDVSLKNKREDIIEFAWFEENGKKKSKSLFLDLRTCFSRAK